VQRVRALVSWNVRTMPARDPVCAEAPSMLRPSTVHAPLARPSNPERGLNSGVLPAPFGPMRAVMEPRCTTSFATSTATRPPKERRSPVTDRIGSGLSTPGSGGTPAHQVSGTALHLPAIAQDALRAEHDQQHEAQAH